jgi:DNA-directed RNA polymerase subunit RPC12/RpoP
MEFYRYYKCSECGKKVKVDLIRRYFEEEAKCEECENIMDKMVKVYYDVSFAIEYPDRIRRANE